jgi:hypothetical protein
VPVLSSGLADPDPLVRSHSAWALGEIGSAEAVATLEVLEPRYLVSAWEPRRRARLPSKAIRAEAGSELHAPPGTVCVFQQQRVISTTNMNVVTIPRSRGRT